jgi:hypothetical protein
MTEGHDDATFSSLVEMDIGSGRKRHLGDLDRYCNIRKHALVSSSHTWRHKETRNVYTVSGVGLACVGDGRMVLMVHYCPQNEGVHPVRFERQHSFFLEKFEPVHPTVVWERVP